MITTSTGTTVRLLDSEQGKLLIADHPSAPPDLRHKEIGRITQFDGMLGFQPVARSEWILTAELLRVIADLVDQEAE